MALIDRIKYNPESDDAIAWKFPSENIRLGAQLIVNESQEAIFFKEGKVLDTFGPGRHNLKTDNLPILHRLVNLPFGGETPFSAEVWYVNKTVKRGLKWGTKKPLPVKQVRNKHTITINVRAFGAWGMCVTDTQSFITQIVGAQTSPSSKGYIGSERIKETFDAAIQQQLNVVLNEGFVKSKISILDAKVPLDELSASIKHRISPEFQRYGIEIESFNIENISIPPEERKMFQEIDLKEMEEDRKFEIEQRETDREFERINQSPEAYYAKRKLDIMEKTAENPGGSAGQLLSAGFGLSAGLGVGFPMGQEIGSVMNTQSQVDKPSEGEPQDDADKLSEGESQDDPVAKLQKLKKMLDDELITEAEYNEKKQQILDDL